MRQSQSAVPVQPLTKSLNNDSESQVDILDSMCTLTYHEHYPGDRSIGSASVLQEGQPIMVKGNPAWAI